MVYVVRGNWIRERQTQIIKLSSHSIFYENWLFYYCLMFIFLCTWSCIKLMRHSVQSLLNKSYTFSFELNRFNCLLHSFKQWNAFFECSRFYEGSEYCRKKNYMTCVIVFMFTSISLDFFSMIHIKKVYLCKYSLLIVDQYVLVRNSHFFHIWKVNITCLEIRCQSVSQWIDRSRNNS